MAIITAKKEEQIKKALLNAVIANKKDKFDDEFISFFKNNVKSMKLTRQKRYTAYFTGEADGKARCSYKTTMSGEPYTDYTDVDVFRIPFADYVASRSPISEKDVSSNAGVYEITKEVQREMNRKHGYDYNVLSVKRTAVRVYSSNYHESDVYTVEFKYRNRKETLSFDGESARSLETTYVPAAKKRNELKAKIVSFLVPFFLALSGFALYYFAASDFCRGGDTLKVICAIAYGAIIFFPFIALLAYMRVHLKLSMRQDAETGDYLFVALETLLIAGIFALTTYLGFFLEI